MRSTRKCQAKDPSACPHHGKEGKGLVAKIKSALNRGDYNAYEEARQSMDNEAGRKLSGESMSAAPPRPLPRAIRDDGTPRTVVSAQEAQWELENSNLSDADRSEADAIEARIKRRNSDN